MLTGTFADSPIPKLGGSGVHAFASTQWAKPSVVSALAAITAIRQRRAVLATGSPGENEKRISTRGTLAFLNHADKL
jgi:hypothetical protein